MNKDHIGQIVGVALFGTFALTAPVAADTITDFYRGKTVTIHVGAGIGSGADIATRTVARNLGKYIPGRPTVLVKNMVGSGGLSFPKIPSRAWLVG